MQIPPTTLTQLAQHGVAYAPQIASAAQRYGLDPDLLAAVAAQETGGPGSNAGANILGDGGHGHGLFQIDDRWHAFANTPAAMDPAQNANYAAQMLSGLLHRYGGNVKAALSAYNAGSPSATGTTTRWGDGRVLGYADSVLRHEASIAGAPPTDAPTAPVATSSPASATPSIWELLEGWIAEQASDAASLSALSGQAQLAPLNSPPSNAGASPNATGEPQNPSITVADLVD